MSYQLYRNSTVGNALQESLDEMIKDGKITPDLAVKVLAQYDRSISKALTNEVKSKLIFKAEKLKTYRFCDKVWILMLNNVQFKGDQQIPDVNTMKIVACEDIGTLKF